MEPLNQFEHHTQAFHLQATLEEDTLLLSLTYLSSGQQYKASFNYHQLPYTFTQLHPNLKALFLLFEKENNFKI